MADVSGRIGRVAEERKILADERKLGPILEASHVQNAAIHLVTRLGNESGVSVLPT